MYEIIYLRSKESGLPNFTEFQKKIIKNYEVEDNSVRVHTLHYPLRMHPFMCIIADYVL